MQNDNNQYELFEEKRTEVPVEKCAGGDKEFYGKIYLVVMA